MEKLGISIIIPCYRAGNFLAETISSIINQPISVPYEIIIVDDFSQHPETTHVLAQIAHMDDIRVVLLPEKSGAQYARNEGIRRSQYRYIMMMDGDDCLNADSTVLSDGTYIDRAIDMLERSPEMAFVHGLTLMFGAFDGMTISAYPSTEDRVMRKHHVPISAVYRKEDAEKSGGYHPSIKKWQDWSFAVGLLNARLKEGKENKIGYLHKPYYLYRVHQRTERISVSDVSEKDMTSATVELYPDIFRKYYPADSLPDIATKVLSCKPDRLIDLLYVANHDLDLALKMAKERELVLLIQDAHKSIP